MDDYIAELKMNLKELAPGDQSDILDFYTNYLRDGGFNDYVDCVKELGSPRELSKNILADYANGRNYQNAERMHAKNTHKNIWIIVLAIVSLPITLPIAIGIFFGIFGLIVGLLAGMFALVVAGTAVLIAGIVLLFSHFSVGLFYGGGGLITIGIFIVLFTILQWLVKWIIYGIKRLFSTKGKHTHSGKGGK